MRVSAKKTMNNLPKEIPPELLKRILEDRRLMVELARRSFFHFFYIFFGPYIQHRMAPFHQEIFKYAQNESVKRFLLISFRGSAKSTICSTAYPLWAITGSLKKKHVVIASHTQQRAYDHSANIAREVEQNELLRKYLGPFEEQQGRWSTPVRVIPRYDARISFVSVEEGIRGLREGPSRPDLIIVDDIEDQGSTKTKEGRDKTFQWLTGELIPAGDIHTKVVFIGNFLHEDSALMRIMKLMQEGKMDGEFLKVPIVDDEGKITWPGKFSSEEALETFRRSIGNEQMWQLEYMLKYIPDTDQLIKLEDIHHYSMKPKSNYYMDSGEAIGVMPGIKGTGVDLAISKKDSADYTAMVSGQVMFTNEIPKLYIDPHPFKGRIDFHETLERAKAILKSCGGFGQFFVENVAYQQAAVQEFERSGLPVHPMHAMQDKRARLSVAAMYIKNGTVLFPEEGCEELIQQLIYFGQEAHDDLVDALVYLILGTVNNCAMELPKVVALLDRW